MSHWSTCTLNEPSLDVRGSTDRIVHKATDIIRWCCTFRVFFRDSFRVTNQSKNWEHSNVIGQALGETMNCKNVAGLEEKWHSLCSVVHIKIVSPAVKTTGSAPRWTRFLLWSTLGSAVLPHSWFNYSTTATTSLNSFGLSAAIFFWPFSVCSWRPGLILL